MSTRLMVVLALVCAIVLSVALSVLSDRGVNFNPFATNAEPEVRSPQFVTRYVEGRDHIIGATEPKIIWIEYGDLECPYCQIFHPIMQQLITEYPHDIAWVFRHYPIASHEYAVIKAEAAECVAELGGDEAFWAYLNLIFERSEPSASDLPAEDLPALAGELGLNSDDVTDCLESARYNERVNDDYITGYAAGVEGTPTSFLIDQEGNAHVLSGVINISDARLLIEEMLGE